jgi:hypothetical protein
MIDFFLLPCEIISYIYQFEGWFREKMSEIILKKEIEHAFYKKHFHFPLYRNELYFSNF